MMLTQNWITCPQKHIPRVILFLRGDPIKSSRAFSSEGSRPIKGGRIAKKLRIYSVQSYEFQIILKLFFRKTTEKKFIL